jgi:hypothetical protein
MVGQTTKKDGWVKNTLHKCIKCARVILWEPNRCFDCAKALKESRLEAANV